MKKLLSYLKPYWILLIIGPLFKLGEAVLELLLPYMMSKIIDIGVAGNDRQYILHMGTVMIITALAGVCCAIVCQYSASIVAQGTGTRIRNALFSHIGTFSNAELDKFGTSSLINRITNDVNQVQWAVAMFIRLVIRAPFLCIGGFVMAFVMDRKLSIILLIVIPVFIFILAITMKKSVPLYRKVQQKLDGIALVLRENLSGIRVIRAFARTGYERKKFEEKNEDYRKNAVLVGKISALLNPLTTLIMNLGICAILWFGGIRVYNGNMHAGEIMAFIGYVTQILAALIVISNLVVVYTKAFASAGRIIEVFETGSSIIDGTGAQGGRENAPAVEFKNVSMIYEAGGEEAISDISFSAEKGETVGITGGTGAGKSTLVNLIPRFYDVSKGDIFVNGINVKEYTLEELREKTGVVPQKTVLFTGTIAENIRWGKENATREEIVEAAKTAQASEFIEKMPDGYDTMISRGGVNVSGGQRQRLTIARALVKKPDILILDDSFNALDYVTDAALRKGIRKYAQQDMTVFIVSQRAGTIRNADKIIVMNDGKIAGIGKHEQLLTECEVYKEIYCSQTQQKEETAS